jgi:hypothetical protein
VTGIEEYFRDSVARGHNPTEEEKRSAAILLERASWLFAALGVDPAMTSGHRVRAKTLELRSSGYAAMLGGTHETAEGGDWADEDGDIDDRITDELLAKYNLYREHPASTRRWVHLQTKAPKSGRRSFYP